MTYGAPWWLRRVGTALAVCSLVYVACLAVVPRAVWPVERIAAGVIWPLANGQRPGLRAVSTYGRLAKYIGRSAPSRR